MLHCWLLVPMRDDVRWGRRVRYRKRESVCERESLGATLLITICSQKCYVIRDPRKSQLANYSPCKDMGSNPD